MNTDGLLNHEPTNRTYIRSRKCKLLKFLEEKCDSYTPWFVAWRAVVPLRDLTVSCSEIVLGRLERVHQCHCQGPPGLCLGELRLEPFDLRQKITTQSTPLLIINANMKWMKKIDRCTEQYEMRIERKKQKQKRMVLTPSGYEDAFLIRLKT